MTCKVVYERYTPIAGKWITIGVENFKGLLLAAGKKYHFENCLDNSKPMHHQISSILGLPEDMAIKFSQDFGTLEWEDRGPIQRWNWISDIAPMDALFKLEEESEYFDPLMQDKAKIIVTKSGNKYTMITKYSKASFSWITTCHVNDNFMIMVSF